MSPSLNREANREEKALLEHAQGICRGAVTLIAGLHPFMWRVEKV
jgi:hypothetical protein